MITWILIGLGGVGAVFVVGIIYLAVILNWERERTVGLAYYGLPAAERAQFRQRLKFHSRILSPVIRVLSRLNTLSFDKARFQVDGVSGPRGSCSEESFQRGNEYSPQPEDVFVVTQMKCGTTWMQHIVYEVLCRGGGDLVDTGTALYAKSPWLEALTSVPIDEAPLIGHERPSRVIKTHLPVSLCPFNDQARYIYVARHPVSCFASCVDFIGANMGAFAPDPSATEEWFCSDDLMWWGTWPDHVAGWWKRSLDHDNVLFVRFEDMKRDPDHVIRQVAAFLGMAPLSEEEMEQVRTKTSFAYMQEHAEAFEMGPPHILAAEAELFVKGTADRHADVPPERRERIMTWSGARLQELGLSLEEVLPAAD